MVGPPQPSESHQVGPIPSGHEEEIYANKFDDLEHLRANIAQFIEQYYNRRRLHSALGYRSPEEFERLSACRSLAADSRSATMRFFETDENAEKRDQDFY